MKDKIKVALMAEPSIGMNQSGMKTQIDTIYNYFKNDSDIKVYKYDIWNYEKPDIIHYFGMSEGMLQLLKIAKSQNVKLVCSPNHWPTNIGILERILLNLNIKNIIYTNRVTKKFLLDHSDLFIVNSTGEKKKFIDVYGLTERKINVIYNSYGSEPINKTDLFLKKYNIKKPYCLLIGMIGAERKNQLPILRNWDSSLPKLYILGGYLKSSYGRKCMDLIDKNKNIDWLGFESDFEVLESAYQNTELLISPGFVETPSLVALRALLNGTSVCSTNGGEVPYEYFKDYAYYFNPNNENEMMQQISNALKEPKNISLDYFKVFSNENILPQYKKNYLGL